MNRVLHRSDQYLTSSKQSHTIGWFHVKQISHSDWLWALLSHERQLWLYYKAFHWYKGDCDTNYESLTTWCWYSGVFGWKYLVLQLVNNVVSGGDAWTWTDTKLCARHNSVLGHCSLWYTDGWQYEKPKNIVIALGLHKHYVPFETSEAITLISFPIKLCASLWMRVLGYFVYMKTIEYMGIFCVNGYFIVYLNDLYMWILYGMPGYFRSTFYSFV